MTPQDRLAQSERRRWRRPLGRLRYGAAQSLRVAWYAAHYALVRRIEARAGPAPHAGGGGGEPIDREKVRAAFLELFEVDRANIEAGLYPPPRDLDPRRLARMLATSRAVLADAEAVSARRRRKGGTEVRDRGRVLGRNGRFPPYYLQNFHYQTDGWLSAHSARIYDEQVEVLFTGAASAMRRAALAEVARELKGRDQRAARLLDVGCGAGSFLVQTTDAFPRLDVEGVDLSPAYVEEAARRLKHRPRARVREAAAETLPYDDGAFDIVVSVYLFHELPPRVRAIVAEEMARVVRPGGLVVIADSIQPGDAPALDPMLEAFPNIFHEPFYKSYAETDLDALWAKAGLVRERETLAFLTKVRTYRKRG
ncbi:MAG: class I SAM-dependent methyltransferase [Maricaulaceae bacterium]